MSALGGVALGRTPPILASAANERKAGLAAVLGPASGTDIVMPEARLTSVVTVGAGRGAVAGRFAIRGGSAAEGAGTGLLGAGGAAVTASAGAGSVAAGAGFSGNGAFADKAGGK